MNATQPAASNTGIGLPGLLFVLFVALKLTNNIDWSWWWVSSPIWGTLVLLLFFATLAAFIKAASDR